MKVDRRRGGKAGSKAGGKAGVKAHETSSGTPGRSVPRVTLPPRLATPLLVAGVVALLAVAAWVRVAPAWSTVFAGPSGVRLFDTDSYYHLRHARFAAAHFPTLQRWDPGIYPDGQPRRYAGLFDVAIGGAALVAGGGHPDAGRVTRVAAFTPVVLGLAACLALFFLVRASRGSAAGLLALALVTLYPGNFVQRSLLGAVDHHAAEIVLAILTAWGLHRGLLPRGEAGARRWPWWRPDFVSALPLVIFFFTWYGAPLYLVVVAATFLGVGTLTLARGDTSAAIATAQAAFRYGAGLVVTATAASLVAPWLIMEAAVLHKALLAAGLFALGVPAYLLLMARAARRLPPAALAVAGLALMGGAVAAAVAAVPEAGRLLGTLFEVKTNLVKEQVGMSLGTFAFLCGAPGFIGLLALPLAAVRVWRPRGEVQPPMREEARLAVVLFATLVVLLWLRTHDYSYVAPPLLAALAADLMLSAWRAARTSRVRIVGGAIAGAALLLPLLPGGAVAPMSPAKATLADFMVLRAGWEQALGWMKTSTPPLAVPLTAPVTKAEAFRHPPGNYGVQAFWDFGHFIAELGERPPVASGGISNSIAAWFLLPDEEQAVHALSSRLRPGEQIRYVIADAQTAGDFVLPAVQMSGGAVSDYVDIFIPGSLPSIRLARFNQRYARSMVARLYEGNGDGLAHFRMVYASPEVSLLAFHAPAKDGVVNGPIVRKGTPFVDAEEQQRWRQNVAAGRPIVLGSEIVYDGAIGPSVKIFEQVAGARLTGEAPAGATVEAHAQLTSRASGHTFHFHNAAAADAAGRFAVTVPYPTEPTDADVSADGMYQVRIGDGSNRVVGQAAVTARDVADGAAVAVAPP